MVRTWRPTPLTISIIDMLKKQSSCTDEELFRNLKANNEVVSPSELNQILLKLEIQGIVQVSNATKGKKKIELRKRLKT
jgi:Fe2+ or Zn2+ uptake regulation protein